MPWWEYAVEDIVAVTNDELVEHLNDMGFDRWELLAIQPNGMTYRCYFKRQKSDDSDG